jgi:O-antigen/teichoic acid export membrane protein
VLSALRKRSYLAVVSGGIAAATAGVNALFQLVAARNLSASGYGELATAIAIIGVLGVAGAGVQMSTAHEIAADLISDGRQRDNHKSSLIAEAATGAVVFLFTFFLVGLGIAVSLLISLFVPTVILLSRANGEIHGRGFFVALALFGLVLSVGKVLFGSAALFVFASVKIALGLQLVVTLIGALLCLRHFRISVRSSLTQFSSRLGPSIIMSALVWLIANLDIFLARMKFDGEVTGNIAVTSLFATVLLVVPHLVATVVYPPVVRRTAEGKSTRPLLVEAFAVSTIASAIAIVVALQLEGFLFDRLVGGSYELARQLFLVQMLSYLPVAGIVGVAPILLVRVRGRELALIALTVCLGSLSLIAFTPTPRAFALGLVFVHVILIVEVLWLVLSGEPRRRAIRFARSEESSASEDLL